MVGGASGTMTQDKLACPWCGGFKSTVIKSRPTGDLSAYTRQRKCQTCLKLYSTTEKIDPPRPFGHI
jgi:transcriptional regulator NrdR family protein